MNRISPEQIDAILPQTQCGQCGYPGCMPYAEALAEAAADINQCPPGGERGIIRLAQLLGREVKPLNPAHGQEKPKAVAVIDEAMCIGCTLCIQACPVDAILGAAKHMHTVLAAECTGCELCIAPCPVDCIVMQPAPVADAAEEQSAADLARRRYRFRQFRLDRDRVDRAERLAAKASHKQSQGTADPTARRAMIEAIMAQARQRQTPTEQS